MPRLALTTWSLHPLLTGPHPPLRLVDLPAQMRAAGISTLELCHFHLPDAAPATLKQLRTSLDAAGVELFSLLIDMGDLSSADPIRRASDIRAIQGWIDTAARLGASAVRVVAGEAAPDDHAALARAIDALRELAHAAQAGQVRVLTENFKALASTAANCQRILDALEGAVGLCADIGNFPAERRIAEFQLVAPHAEVVHVKASYNRHGEPDVTELRHCLDATRAAHFDGPYTLVYDREDNPWQGLARLRTIVAPYTARQ